MSTDKKLSKLYPNIFLPNEENSLVENIYVRTREYGPHPHHSRPTDHARPDLARNERWVSFLTGSSPSLSCLVLLGGEGSCHPPTWLGEGRSTVLVWEGGWEMGRSTVLGLRGGAGQQFLVLWCGERVGQQFLVGKGQINRSWSGEGRDRSVVLGLGVGKQFLVWWGQVNCSWSEGRMVKKSVIWWSFEGDLDESVNFFQCKVIIQNNKYNVASFPWMLRNQHIKWHHNDMCKQFPPMTLAQNTPTYHKSAKVYIPKSCRHPGSITKLTQKWISNNLRGN